jgi:hypothetical protein
MPPTIDNQVEMTDPGKGITKPGRPGGGTIAATQLQRARAPRRRASDSHSSDMGDRFGELTLPEWVSHESALVRQAYPPPGLIPGSSPATVAGSRAPDPRDPMPSGTAGEAETVAARAEGKTPCNVRRIAMIRCRALSCPSMTERSGRRPSKQEFLRRCR